MKASVTQCAACKSTTFVQTALDNEHSFNFSCSNNGTSISRSIHGIMEAYQRRVPTEKMCVAFLLNFNSDFERLVCCHVTPIWRREVGEHDRGDMVERWSSFAGNSCRLRVAKVVSVVQVVRCCSTASFTPLIDWASDQLVYSGNCIVKTYAG
jgi:hypothetical protein